MAMHLHKGDEARRRWKIIDASRAGDSSLLPQLLARLDGDESYENRRHIVPTLGNVGGPRAEAKLIELLKSQSGPILGDVCHSLGKLGSRPAAPLLRALADHESEWVRQNVRFALRRIVGDA